MSDIGRGPDQPYGEIDQTAIIYGKVIIHGNAFITPYAVIHADEVDAQGEMKTNS
ncbi:MULTISPECIES: hypothetical protein [unclassified Psychrobacter]|uniref:hypothetical protein n=1 Tax=unclassified Psychrobacter TaxID=196806 RepID=UPI00402BE322